jgi:hypothetical protein
MGKSQRNENGDRSAILRELLLKEWRTRIKYAPAVEQEAWLDRVGELALGRAEKFKHLKKINSMRLLIADLAPTPAWAEAWESSGEKIPMRLVAIKLLFGDQSGVPGIRDVAAINCRGMGLSPIPTQVGEYGIARCRLQPLSGKGLEQRIDEAERAMDWHDDFHGRPLTARMVCAMGLKERRRRLKLGRPKRESTR